MVTMALGGLWHGASWTFMIWGIWHGIGLVVGRAWNAMRMPAVPAPVGHVVTLVFVMIGWTLFRAQDWQTAATMFSGLAGQHGFAMSNGFAAALRPVEVVTLFVGIAMVYLPALSQSSPRLASVIARPPFLLAAILWLWSLWVMQSRTVIPFLYFQF
jgi:alginate O-acetyltransferase complex protein AlgI